MGYYSDIAIAFAFAKKEDLERVYSVWKMQEDVVRLHLSDEWDIHQWGDVWGLTYTQNDTKWYDSFPEVSAIESMLAFVKSTYEAQEDEFVFAYRKIRLGEDLQDIEREQDSSWESNHVNSDISSKLEDLLEDRLDVVRKLHVAF